MEPLYVAEPGGGRYWALILIVLGGTMAFAAIGALLSGSEVGFLAVLVSIALTAGLLANILPRRYEVWPDSLTLVFLLWRWPIPFSTVDYVRASKGFEPYGFIGIRFATAPDQAITVIRRNANLFKRPNLVISPRDREALLSQLQRRLAPGDGGARP